MQTVAHQRSRCRGLVAFGCPTSARYTSSDLVCKIVDSVRPDSVSVLTNLRLFVECEVIGEGLLG